MPLSTSTTTKMETDTASICQTAVLPSTTACAVDVKSTVLIAGPSISTQQQLPSHAATAFTPTDHKHAADDPAPAGADEEIFRAIHCMQCSLPLVAPVADSDIPILQQNGAMLKHGQWTVRGKAVMRKCMKWMTPTQQREFVMLEHQWTPRQLMEMKKNKEKTKNKKTK